MVELLKRADQPDLQAKAAQAIAAACAQNRDNRREVLQAGGVAGLVGLLSSNHAMTQASTVDDCPSPSRTRARTHPRGRTRL
jgi:hypothetical protein